MMRFTKQEIMFLTSVSRGRLPFGIDCPMPSPERREQYVSKTVETLQQKGILDENKKLTQEGADMVYFWERYRNSRLHIRLNRISAAVLPENILIVAIETEDGYEVAAVQSELLMEQILKRAEYLCSEEIKAQRGHWQDMSREEQAEQIETSDGCIFLSEYISGRVMSEKVYFWKDKKGYLLNRSSNRVRELSAGVMRKQIYRTLQGEMINGKETNM